MKVLFVGNYLRGSNVSQSFLVGEKLANEGFCIIRAGTSTNKLMRSIQMVAAVLRPGKKVVLIDVFSGAAFYWALGTTLLAHLKKYPVVLTLHGGGLPEFSNKRKWLLKILFRYANSIISPSPYLKAKLSPFTHKIIQVIPNAIDFRVFRQTQRKPDSILNIAWLRAYDAIYNPSLLVQALCEYKQKSRNLLQYRVFFAGPVKNQEIYQKLQKLAVELHLQKDVCFLESLKKEDIPLFLADKDVFVNTTSVDNTPVTLIEAAAAGCAIVSTKVGGIPFLFEDGKTASLFEANNVHALCNILIDLAEDPSKLRLFQQNGREFAKTMDWAEITSSWAQLIQNLE